MIRRCFIVAAQAQFLVDLLSQSPNAYAQIYGSQSYPNINGLVYLYQLPTGVFLIAQVQSLPDSTVPCAPNIYAFHIHSGNSCTGNAEDPFADTDGHFNPRNCLHPAHAGDLPSLFGNHGFALMSVFTDRFNVDEVIGKTFVVHAHPDDFVSQPAGNSGAKIACGRILAASAQ
jgi:superoxide dismutase, Cu-Zn family